MKGNQVPLDYNNNGFKIHYLAKIGLLSSYFILFYHFKLSWNCIILSRVVQGKDRALFFLYYNILLLS